MSGKTQTSTSSVAIPQSVLNRYTAVNSYAQKVAQTPFQQYSTNPSSFVAQLNPTEQAGIVGANTASTVAQPYYQAATGLTEAGTQNANPTALGAAQINKYESPYLQNVLGNTEAMTNLQNQQQQAGQEGNAITSGAFGGDRSGIAAANLGYEQQLAGQNAYAGIANQAYSQALGTAQQQQGLSLSAQQANLARQLQGGQQLAGLGTGAQAAAESGAQGQLAAGQLQQQTQQAGLTALYNQFLQQQGYPFQTAQFLANIAEGTGALSGSTTTTTQPAPFFSDERLKDDIEPIGKTFDGQNIVKFRYKGQKQKQIGLVAQDVERHHPKAVGLAAGYKTVDYDDATKDAAKRGHFARGGLAPSESMGGTVSEDGFERKTYDTGGMPTGGGPADWYMLQQILQNQRAIEASSPGSSNLYGGSPDAMPFGQGSNKGIAGAVASGSNTPRQIAHVAAPPSDFGAPVQSQLSQIAQLGTTAQGLGGLYNAGSKVYDWGANKINPGTTVSTTTPGTIFAQGGLVARKHYDAGGGIDPYSTTQDQNGYVPTQQNPALALKLAQSGVPVSTPTSPFAQLAGTAVGLNGLGQAASGLGSGVGQLMTFLGLSTGGVAGRKAYADGGMDDTSQEDEAFNALHPPAAGIAPVVPVDKSPSVNDNAAGVGSAAPAIPPSRPVGLGAASATASSALTAPTNVPRSVRNNNPGNIEDGPFARNLPGYQGNDGRFAVFDSPQSGSGAMDKLLSVYGDKGLNTPSSVVGTWAPASENGKSTDNYAAYVAGKLGIGANDPIDMSDPAQRSKLASAMSEFEAGNTHGGHVAANPGASGLAGPIANAASGISSAAQGVGGSLANIGSGITNAGHNVGGYFKENQDWLVPLLTGLGTMASSNSRYLGSALLQGLGGAAQGYETVQGQQAQRATQEAQALAENARTASGSIVDIGGVKMVRVLENGQWVLKPLGGSGTTTAAGDISVPTGISGPKVVNPVISAPAAPSNAPTAPAAPTAPTIPVAKAPIDNSPFTPTPEETAEGAQKAKNWYATLGSNLDAAGPDLYTPQQAAATDAQKQKNLLLPLASALSQLPPGGSLATSGAAQGALHNITAELNHLGQVAGLKDFVVKDSDLANQNEVDKLTSQFQSQAAGAEGQHSFAAFSALAHNIPSLLTSPGGQGKLVGQIMSQNQRDIDANEYMNKYRGAISGPNSLYEGPASRTGRLAQQNFNNKFGDNFYQPERDALTKIFNTNVTVGGKQVPLFQYLQSGQPIPGKLKTQIEAMAPHHNILRYFGAGNGG